MFEARTQALPALAAVALVVALAVLAPVAFGGPFGTDEAGSDSVRFAEVGTSCGIEYRTSGNADGSDDGGVFVADVDRDGDPDLLAVGGGPTLFENTGEGFERSGALPDREYPPIKSALFFDAHGDGWEDLLLVPRKGSPVFLANEEGRFREADAGFDVDLQWGTGATAADVDGDGSLEVFVIQNGDWRAGTPRRGASGEATDGYPNLLFDDRGQGFERVDADVAGGRWSLATGAADLTGDGRPDVYVANDYGYDALLVNRGDGTFERRTIPDTNSHGMATVLRDVNGDGHLDAFVTNIRFRNPQEVWALDSGLNVRNTGNTLLINRGNGTFAERAGEYGLRQGGWGWAAAIEDFDNDRALEVLHATQDYLRRTDDGSFDGVETTPALWEGTGEGFERRNASEAGFVPANGRGLATFDFDGDGDRDVVVADTSGRFKLYENREDDGNWLQVRVEDEQGAPDIGTRVRVETGGDAVTRVVHSRSNFFSQSARTLQFGLGSETVERVRVTRPDGSTATYEDVATNARLLVRGDGNVSTAAVGESGC